MAVSRTIIKIAVAFTLVISAPQSNAFAAVINYTSDVAFKVDLIVDVRPASRCEKTSLAGAHCLPIADVLGPHKRLANISGLLWLLGTVGLTGSEHVMVIGDKAVERDFIAGLLFVAGQKRISILEKTITKNKTLPGKHEAGLGRAQTREVVFQAPMRSQHIVLRSELLGEIRSAKPPVILDGRSEREYWGSLVRATRGGHIPGAQHSPLSAWSDNSSAAPVHTGQNMRPVLYGHDASEGLALLARVIAKGQTARLYLEGWVGWASDGALPADVVTYPVRQRSATPAARVSIARNNQRSFLNSTLALLIAGAVCMGAGALLGYGIKTNKEV